MRIVTLSSHSGLLGLSPEDFALRNYDYHAIVATPAAMPAGGADAIGLDRLESLRADLVIFETDLPAEAIAALADRLRSRGIEAPLLVVTSPKEAPERTILFNAGVDHLAFTPVHPPELMARIAVLLRRSEGQGSREIRNGVLTMDLASRVAWAGSTRLDLSPKELRILEILMLRRGRSVSRDSIMDHLYSGIDEPAPKILDVFLCKLRQKIERATGEPAPIETQHGHGFYMPAVPPRDRRRRVA
jgi:two-component system cell cycle response regulator CtrA